MATQRSAVAEPRSLLAPAWTWYLVFFLIPLGFIAVYSLAINQGFFSVRFGVNTDQLSVQISLPSLGRT